jgi:hypothetical protein
MIVINGVTITVSKMICLQAGQVRNHHLILIGGKKCSYSPKLPGCETDLRPATSAQVNPSVAKLKKIPWLAEWGTFLPQNTISMYIT